MRDRRRVALLWLAISLSVVVHGAPLPRFDFTAPGVSAEWAATHDIAKIESAAEGMRIVISGADPYSVGPVRDYPASQALWLCVRLNSEQAGTLQVFYFAPGSPGSEEESVRIPVRGGKWEIVRTAMPPLGPGYRLRIDPPGTAGACTISSLWLEDRTLLQGPAWPRPEPPAIGHDALRVSSGEVVVTHARTRLGAFSVMVGGQPMATGNVQALIGYTTPAGLRWVPLASVPAQVRASGAAVTATASVSDPDGATWRIEQRFSPSRTPGVIEVATQVTVDHDRSVVYLPMLTLLPGLGSFGPARGQALMPGLEYLDAPDVSSSEADIIGPGSHRQVPDTMRVCFPLLALQSQDRSVGLSWQPDTAFCPVFDTPDRQFRSGAHLMGLLFPGSDGQNRVEGSLLPYQGLQLSAGRPVVLHAAIMGTKGPDILPMVRLYVALRGLPPVPATPPLADYAALAAAGWLDSRLSDGPRFRHAWWPGLEKLFQPGAVADAAMYMDWLAAHVADPALAQRLRERAAAAAALVPPADLDAACVAHVRYPVECLLYGHVGENVAQARAAAQAELGRFNPDGTITYRPDPKGLDYAKTHFARDANGYTAPAIVSVLEAGVLSGDRQLIQEGLRLLRALGRYDHTVPRGASTWEIPLHAPDILASTWLVRAYTLGYEITGEQALLDKAREWAWSGLPFIYLTNPTGQDLGPYASSGVFGATHWIAPNWMGQPVQWCVLVYADAIRRLSRYDAAGPWGQLARGITASGIQQVYPRGEPDVCGLLPDSINLRPQTRNGAAINPGTLEANAVPFYTGAALYDFRAFRSCGLFVHAPGPISAPTDKPGSASFTVQGWPEGPYRVLVSGVPSEPRVLIDGSPVTLSEPNEWHPGTGILVLTVRGKPQVVIQVTPGR